MNSLGPISRVVDQLVAVGYRPQPTPAIVATIPWEFSAVLLGADRALDLIVVIDTSKESEKRLRQKLEGLARALDLVASKRPVTAVLVGPALTFITLDAISRVCRVLQLGTPTGERAEESISHGIAVLMPLQLPNNGEIVQDPMKQIRKEAMTSEDDLSELVTAANSGAEAVKIAFADMLAKNLTVIEVGDL